MKKITILALLCFIFIASSNFAASEISILKNKKHHVGVRLGTWSNSGDTHPTIVVFPNAVDTLPPTDSLITSIQNVNFFLEGYYAYNLYSSFYSELTFGMVNRGNIEIHQGGILDYSNILIYPILLQIKFYPLLSSTSKFQPFIGAGGGIYLGKQDIQFTNDVYAQYYNVQGESENNFNYTLSGGFDWKFNNTISVDLQAKYMPITFSDYFIGEKDYTATTITVGFKYNYNSKNKSKK